MAESFTARLAGFIFSAPELADLNLLFDKAEEAVRFPGPFIEDYLTILENFSLLAGGVDIGDTINIQTISADYTTKGTDGTILVDASANAVTISLDATATEGQYHSIKVIDDTNTVLVYPNGNEMDGDSGTFKMYVSEYIEIRADSDNNWWVS